MIQEENIFCITPFQNPDVHLTLAIKKSGAFPFLDLGLDINKAQQALKKLSKFKNVTFGIRIPEGLEFNNLTLPSNIEALLFPDISNFYPMENKLNFVQVTSVEEALEAEKLGAHGIIAKGNEAGGKIGESCSFILLQQLKGKLAIPYWIQGGIGIHTAAAAFVAGAQGIVLDSQLALLEESKIEPDLKAIIKNMDGTATSTCSNYRFLIKHNPVLKIKPQSNAKDIYEKFTINNFRKNYIPCGQDISFAKIFADKYRSIENTIYAINLSIAAHIKVAKEIQPIGSNSTLAQNHKTKYPIVQGPMSSVSDSPEFAFEVAKAGGLPFLAMSLIRGETAEKLLHDTKELLNGKSWGVGLLGFTPSDIYTEQRDYVLKAKPPFVIIAGGKPSQAKEFEKEGISCYLHAPTGGLSKIFLSEGLRKFIFEGRGCGGHVGPLSSFVIWECQIHTLLEQEIQDDLSILFAGGIHDGLSSAMVSTITATLAHKGAKIGILLGTPYIYTNEIVESGAILNKFQQKVVDQNMTALLESGPGHATRCIDSPYVHFFNKEKKKLLNSNTSIADTRDHLEKLNIGRLRMASKGLKWENNKQHPINTKDQEQNGLYMIGQSATLLNNTFSLNDLHEDTTTGCVDILDKLPQYEQSKTEGENIAIVGMACVYPGASNLEEFWSNIIKGKDSITDVPESRWNKELYFDPKARGGTKSYSHKGGFIPSILFDPISYGIPPQSLASIEPVQLLSLEVSNRALENAGYGKKGKDFNQDNAAVIFGIESGNELAGLYGFRAVYPRILGDIPRELDEKLPKFTEDSFPGILGNIVTGRIANRLDLKGPNYTVNAACASSLTAIDAGIKELRYGKSNLVIVGGADLHNSINDYIMFCNTHALSRQGKCKSFDAESDGTLLGEGIAALVLKRLEDAILDDDRIYAVIKGCGSASDGKSLGLTAPRVSGQVSALNRAYSDANVSPAEIGLVEAHGTATIVGDRAELKALTEVYSFAGASINSCALGSLKTQIGHTKCAAGIGGVIKTALSIYNGVLPPTLNISKPNPVYNKKQSPFYFNCTSKPWGKDIRKGAVSALGFGGTNFHVVLGQDKSGFTNSKGYDAWPYELLLFKGKTREEALDRMTTVEQFIDTDYPLNLRDIAYTLSCDSEAVQLALIVESIDDLKKKLVKAKSFSSDMSIFTFDKPQLKTNKVAFLFSGQGAQRTGMIADLFIAFPKLQKYLSIGEKWFSYIYPGAVFTDEEKSEIEKKLTSTDIAQPALGIVEMALAELLTTFGIEAEMTGGHSYGELAALAYSGALTSLDLFALSEKRGQSILKAAGNNPGTMLVVAASHKEIAKSVEKAKNVWISNMNSPQQTALSGTVEGIEEINKVLSDEGFRTTKINVSCPFHSPIIQKASDIFAKELECFDISKTKIPVWSNRTASPYENSEEAIKDNLTNHIINPVRFTEQIESMYDTGARIFIEVGPGRIITNFVSKTLKDKDILALPTDIKGSHGIKTLLKTLVSLMTQGINVKTEQLFKGRLVEKLDFSIKKSLPATMWKINGFTSQPVNGKFPPNLVRPITKPIQIASTAGPLLNNNVNNSNRDSVMMEYLNTIKNVMDTQKDIMVRYLGGEQPLPSSSISPNIDSSNQIIEPAPIVEEETIDNNKGSSEKTEAVDFKSELVNIVSEKTGYPLDMLDLNLDLESDLSIDSIKRIEILGELSNKIALVDSDANQESLLEDLASIKTLQGIIDWFEKNQTANENIKKETVTKDNDFDFKEKLLTIVSEKTGYPKDMLDLNLDLEADLSIDSIKRMEILGELTGSIDMPDTVESNQEALLEELAGIKTLQGIIDWFSKEKKKTSSENDITEPNVEQNNSTINSEETNIPIIDNKIYRYLVNIQEAPLNKTKLPNLKGKKFVISDVSNIIVKDLQNYIVKLGATVVKSTEQRDYHDIDGLIYVASPVNDAASKNSSIYEFFSECKKLNPNKLSWLCAITGLGGKFGFHSKEKNTQQYNGVCGLVKTLSKEWMTTKVKVIDVSFKKSSKTIAKQAINELFGGGDQMEVSFFDGKRFISKIEEKQLKINGEKYLTLNKDSLIVITGGAKGITSEVAKTLASNYKCNLALLGRSRLLDTKESDLFSHAKDAIALRKAIIQSGQTRKPAEIEVYMRSILSDREIRKTLAHITALGGKVNYYSIDVLDENEMKQFIEKMYQEYGNIDGFIHSAGIIEDKYFRDKTKESFQRVYDTKVNGAYSILNNINNDLQFFVFFSSIAGVFGSKGQSDYAAANSALDKIALQMNKSRKGRYLSVNWGPWDNVGMVTEELKREFAKNGMGLIPLKEGANFLISELIYGDTNLSQIVAMSSSPEIVKEMWVN